VIKITSAGPNLSKAGVVQWFGVYQHADARTLPIPSVFFNAQQFGAAGLGIEKFPGHALSRHAAKRANRHKQRGWIRRWARANALVLMAADFALRDVTPEEIRISHPEQKTMRFCSDFFRLCRL
jgi:hypothetical protein